MQFGTEKVGNLMFIFPYRENTGNLSKTIKICFNIINLPSNYIKFYLYQGVANLCVNVPHS